MICWNPILRCPACWAWLFVLLSHCLALGTGLVLLISGLLVAALLSGICFLWVWMDGKREEDG
jgi:hypothetical protein